MGEGEGIEHGALFSLQLTASSRQPNVDENSKLQITNNNQITMTEIPNSKPLHLFLKNNIPKTFRSLDTGIWNLFVIWCLGFRISQ